jgi:predicted molibdopterin-dependent oxidoreductase YjgC
MKERIRRILEAISFRGKCFNRIPNEPKKASRDTEAREIKQDDMVRVFNDRGETILPVKISERIMPGVVDIPEGA